MAQRQREKVIRFLRKNSEFSHLFDDRLRLSFQVARIEEEFESERLKRPYLTIDEYLLGEQLKRPWGRL